MMTLREPLRLKLATSLGDRRRSRRNGEVQLLDQPHLHLPGVQEVEVIEWHAILGPCVRWTLYDVYYAAASSSRNIVQSGLISIVNIRFVQEVCTNTR